MYKFIFNKILIKTDPEKIHNFVHFLLKIYGSLLKVFPFIKLNKTKSDFGIAAGFDKDASAILGLYGLGFGFVEIGTVTPLPQKGNKKPRSWRCPPEFSLRNFMGFPGPGVDKVAYNLRKFRNSKIGKRVIVGANIGKNDTTSSDKAANDYLLVAQKLINYVDYLVINVSCPNTPSLLKLQNANYLRPIIIALKTFSSNNGNKPIYVKISPDLTDDSIKSIAELVNKTDIKGVIATNTTLKHNKFNNESDTNPVGGLSGKPLMKYSLHTVKILKKYLSENKEIIGCGGIFTKQDFSNFKKAGANKSQGFTGFVYNGPFWIRKL
jgi:dihydroorotate dehydrogenase